MAEEQKPYKPCRGCGGAGWVWVVGPDGKTPVQGTCPRCMGTGIE